MLNTFLFFVLVPDEVEHARKLEQLRSDYIKKNSKL
jgi:hypothetical protein